jgi:hypothetical protein
MIMKIRSEPALKHSPEFEVSGKCSDQHLGSLGYFISTLEFFKLLNMLSFFGHIAWFRSMDIPRPMEVFKTQG